MGATTLLGVDEVVVQDALRRVFFLGGAIGKQSFLLVDDEEVLVLVDDAQPRAISTTMPGSRA